MSKQFLGFAKSTKFRVIVNQISFYATKSQIIDGVGDFVNVNGALRTSLASFEGQKAGNPRLTGIGISNVCGYSVQLDLRESKTVL